MTSTVRSRSVEICTKCKGRGVATYEHEEEGSHGRPRSSYHDEACRDCDGSGRVEVVVTQTPYVPPARPPQWKPA